MEGTARSSSSRARPASASHASSTSSGAGFRRASTHGSSAGASRTDRLPEHYETIAFHAELGEQWDQAFEYLKKSGDKALASFASERADDFYERALALVERGSVAVEAAQRIALHDGRGQALYLLNRWAESAASFEAMRREAEAIGDQVQVGVALFNAGVSLFWGHRFEDAMAAAECARVIGLEHGNDAIVAGALITIEGVYSVTGDQAAAREVVEEASRFAARSQVPLLEGVTDIWAGFNHHWRGAEVRALEIWEKGTRIGRDHALPIVLLWSLWTQSLALLGQGRYDEALTSLHEHLDLTRRLGDRVFRCRTLNTLGWAYMDLCNWELAVQYNQQGAEESYPTGDPEIIRNAELNLADCYLVRGDLDEAQRVLESVEEGSLRSGGWGEDFMKWRYTQHMNVGLGELWLARGDVEKALHYADECLRGAEASESKRNITKGRRLRGKALQTLGRSDEAAADLELALRAAREVGNPAQIWQTLDALGRPTEAFEAIEGVAAGLADPGLRNTLLASPQVAAIRGRAG